MDCPVNQSSLEIDHSIKDHPIYRKITSQINLKREYTINDVKTIG